MVNLKYSCVGCLKSILVCGFENIGWSKISSIDMKAGKLLLNNVAKHREIK